VIDDEIGGVALLTAARADLHALLVRGPDDGEYVPEDSILSVL
jgi:hypothetical protein